MDETLAGLAGAENIPPAALSDPEDSVDQPSLSSLHERASRKSLRAYAAATKQWMPYVYPAQDRAPDVHL